MGALVRKLAIEKGYEVNAIIDPSDGNATHKEITLAALKDVDVCIEFSSANAVVDNVKKIAALGKAHVLATTGWYDKLAEVRKIIENSNIPNTGFIYSTNFSIGVNVFFRLVEDAAKIINNLPDYDIFGYELHHNRKADSPSGTAKTLAELIVANVDRKKKIIYDKIDRKISGDELHFASIRGGDIPGTHVIGFDSTADTIELKHTARNREGFALGSIMAADWVFGKKGFFEIKDMIKDVVK